MPRPRKQITESQTTDPIVLIKAEAKEEAKAQLDLRPSSGDSMILSTEGGIFTYQGRHLKDEQHLIFLDEILEYTWFEKDYVKGEFKSPNCYSFSEPLSTATKPLTEGMKPHKECSEPQNKDCASCPKNVFGTSKNGKGKACSDRVKLVGLTADTLDDMDRAMPFILRVPPTALKVYNSYVNWLYRVKELPIKYTITKVTLQKIQETDTASVPMFDFAQELPDAVAVQVSKLIEANRHILLQPYPKNEFAKKPAPKRRTTSTAKTKRR